MKNQQRYLIFGGVIAVVAVVAVAAILVSNTSGTVQGARFDYASMSPERLEDGGFIIGDPDAPITVVEFADFMCSHCQSYKSTMEQLIEEHVATGNARFEYRLFPTVDRQGFTHGLAECAAEDDPVNFWVAHDILFDIAPRWNQESGQEFADRMGLNYGELLNCVREADQFMTDAQLGQRAGVTGTPAIRIRLGDESQLRPIGANERGAVPYNLIEAAILQAQ